jgi:preprotein translocase subunit SecY
VDVLVPVFFLLAFVLPLVHAPRWLAWAMPVLVAAAMAQAYVHERNATSGDPQPNLILITGIVLTVASILAVLLGLRIERSMRPDTK